MSYTADFRAILPPETDRRGALETARGFATRWKARECRVTDLDGESARSMAAVVDGHGISIEIETTGTLPARLPDALLHGGAANLEFSVSKGVGEVATGAGLRHDERGVPSAAMVLEGHGHGVRLDRLSPAELESIVRERLALAGEAAVLPSDSTDDPGSADGHSREIPIRADAFAKLARSLGLAHDHETFQLHAQVLPGHAVEFMAALAGLEESVEWSCTDYVVQLEVDSDQAFEALCDLPTAPTVRWAEPESNEWITGRRPDGRLASDGKLYSITFGERKSGPGPRAGSPFEIVAGTVLDHIDRRDAISWLEERAGVPMEYVKSTGL